MKEQLVAAWAIFCGLALFVLFAFRRRSGAAKIIRLLHLGFAPKPDPRILLVWGSVAIGMGLLLLIWATVG